MPTLLRQLPISNPDSVGLSAIVLPTDEELAVFDSVANWWRADVGVGVSTWTDRKAAVTLGKLGASMPAATDVAAYNSKKALTFSGSAYALGGLSLLPTSGSFSVVMVGRQGSADNANLWATGHASNQTKLNAQDSSGYVTFSVNNGTIGAGGVAANTPAYPRYFSGGPYISVCSYDDVADEVGMRLDRGRCVRTSPTSGGPNNNSQFNVGGAGPTGTSGAIDGGDVAEVMIFHIPLLAAANAALLADLEIYLGDRYAITAP